MKLYKDKLLYIIYFSMFSLLVMLLVIRSSRFKKSTHHTMVKINKLEVIKHSYDDPQDFAERKDLTANQKDYYEYLYQKSYDGK